MSLRFIGLAPMNCLAFVFIFWPWTIGCKLSTQKHTKSCIFITGKPQGGPKSKKENHALGAILYA
jgi:hypothetical protein